LNEQVSMLDLRLGGSELKGADIIHVGTSGWHYDHWKGPFYPDEVTGGDRLEYYAKRFRTVEVNSSFYRLPEVRTLRRWRETVPRGFAFSVKASRYITHVKKLKDPGDTLPPLLNRIESLEDSLGPVLFQLQPSWKCDHERLGSFLGALPRDFRYVFEFRNPDWFNERTLELLSQRGAAFCIFEIGDVESPRRITSEFTYIRLHGPGKPYQGSYTTGALSGWADAFSSWAGGGTEVFCYFDNDDSGYAALNAAELSAMIR
jgi:uncharacterized protein YecE (DUF72 family)